MIEVQIAPVGGLCIDGDGNQYQTVKIGEQIWMAENLKTTKYNDGTAIAFVDDEDAEANVWENLTTGAYSRGGPDGTAADDNYEDTYGFFYNWYAVDTEKLAPKGWHVPSNYETGVLESYLDSNQGSKISGSADLWDNGSLKSSSDFGTTNFNAKPGGLRLWDTGYIGFLGEYSVWWTTTAGLASNYYYWLTHYNSTAITRNPTMPHYGFNIRCLRDISEVSVSSQAMSGVSITVPPSYGSSDRWDTFDIPWDDSIVYWSSSWEEDELVKPAIP